MSPFACRVRACTPPPLPLSDCTASQRNLAPSLRADRRQTADRETVERSRLAARREGFGHYADPGASLVKPDARDSALYQADSDRFNTDVAAEQKFLREQAAAKKQAELLRRREEVGVVCSRVDWSGAHWRAGTARHRHVASASSNALRRPSLTLAPH
jgi:hypothetical protein